MIGTTDTLYKGDINKPLPNQDEIDYLLHVVNQYTGKNQLNRSDITAAWAGCARLWARAAGKQPAARRKCRASI